MANISFIDRETELKLVEEKEKENFFLVFKGRRRIGKTTFLKKCFPQAAYIFIWPNKSLSWIMEKTCAEHSLPSFRNFTDLLNYLLDQRKIIVLDEFQNFLSIDKSVYGEIQKLVDERKKEKFMKIAVAGSSYSLMNKVFNSAASPLYGRRTGEITLSHLPPQDLFAELNSGIEDFIKLWGVFEGVPYYYEHLDGTAAEKNIQRLLLSKNALLQDEGRAVLSVEFGQDSRTYGTVLMAIAEGKTKLNEIAGLFGNRATETIKYLSILRKEFRLIRRLTPLLADPVKSKEGRYEIIDNFLDFWFFFLDKRRDYIEQERFPEMEKYFRDNFSLYMGKKFEKFVFELISRGIIGPGFPAEKFGRQWGAVPNAPQNKNQYVIDILALNGVEKKALFCECKWSDNVSAEKIARELIEKAQHVAWNNEKRKESLMLFAKSFSRKINEFEGKEVRCLDLNDIEKMLKKPK